jgi:hypothetical protein
MSSRTRTRQRAGEFGTYYPRRTKDHFVLVLSTSMPFQPHRKVPYVGSVRDDIVLRYNRAFVTRLLQWFVLPSGL